MLKYWRVFLGLVAVALFVPSIAATPAAKASTCPSVLVVGLHGLNEGPSSTISMPSATIADTFGAFQNVINKTGPNNTSTQHANYESLGWDLFTAIGGIQGALTSINSFAGSLESSLESFSSTCPGSGIELAGYSLGAWIINDMLTTYNTEWRYIAAVVLYGDPCWYNPSGGYTGLARHAGGCIPESTYPCLSSTCSSSPPFLVESWCNSKDPICGQNDNLAQQLAGVAQCITTQPNASGTSPCTHFDYIYGYPNSGATVYGGQFLASEALRSSCCAVDQASDTQRGCFRLGCYRARGVHDERL